MKRTARWSAVGACTAAVIIAQAQPVAAGPLGDTSLGSQVRLHEGAQQGVDQPKQAGVEGMDVSRYQGDVDWRYWWDQGKRFVYVKATEGVHLRNPKFSPQYRGSYDVGMIRGAYHFALPDRSSGADQANFFVDNGGGWSRDGRTLPGTADLEYNPYGETCYGKSPAELVAWIHDFSSTYRHRTGVHPVFYTSTSWWSKCTANSGSFRTTNPLWLARYAPEIGPLPHDWSSWTFWQYTSDPLDQNRFNGSFERLQALANG